ncbi:MAG: hypothetical protein ACPLSO_01485 [Fervidicoccaceae archaeon]
MEKKPLWLEKSLEHLLKLSLELEKNRNRDSNIPPSIEIIKNDIVDRIKSFFLEKNTENGKKFDCLLCHKKGLTRKGMYYHLVRVHRRQIEIEILNVIEEKFSATKKGSV